MLHSAVLSCCLLSACASSLVTSLSSSLSPHPLLPSLASALPSSYSHSADNLQAKVAEHRRMLRESDKTGHRPRIKGRFGTHAEQLRNWLGEYLLAKYDLTCQINPQREIAGYATHA